jgi:tRNA A-37 threonylcarbamoyl transferase component Bud32
MRGSLRAPAVRWLALAGPPPDAIVAALLGLPGARAELEAVAKPTSRGGVRSMRATLDTGERLFAKLYPARAPGRRGLRALAARLRPDAARREWRALRRLAAAGVPVPAPRALGRLRGGERLLVTGHCSGPTLAAALAAGAPGRALVPAVGAAIARLHGAGFAHGDLQAGRLVLAEAGPVFVGVRSARRSRRHRARLRDLAALEHSIVRRLRLVDRVRLRAAALGLRRPFDAGARRSLASVACGVRARGLAHARACMRRARRGRTARSPASERCADCAIPRSRRRRSPRRSRPRPGSMTRAGASASRRRTGAASW